MEEEEEEEAALEAAVEALEAEVQALEAPITQAAAVESQPHHRFSPLAVSFFSGLWVLVEAQSLESFQSLEVM